MKKRFLSTAVACLALLLCVGCSSAPSKTPDADQTTHSTSAETTAEKTDSATEAHTDPQTDAVTDAQTEAQTDGQTDAETEAVALPTLNGTPLSEFVIVYDYEEGEDRPYGKRAAEYLQSTILARTGLELTLAEDSDEGVYLHEIVVGETNREISVHLNAETEGMEFAILAEGDRIALEGDAFIIAAAAYFFAETYIPGDSFDSLVPAQVSVHEPIVEEAKNYVLMIGDGMGVNQTKLFEMYENSIPYGDGESFFYGEYFPYAGLSRTDSLSGTTDSAAGGTALSSGLKTVNGYVGQDASHNPVQSLTELAGSKGLSTAVLSTEVATGATPASFSAHANDRGDTSDIQKSQRDLRKTYGTTIYCNYDFYTESLVETRLRVKLMNILEELGQNEAGFFMMYEEAYIDKHCHNNDGEMAFRAVVRFNQAIALVMEYAFYHPDTFVLITADHETGNLLPGEDGGFVYNSGNHSSQDVPVFAYGDGGQLFHGKTIENIQIPQTIASFMGVTDFGDRSVFAPLTE